MRCYLEQQQGYTSLPAISTITEILRRYGRISLEASAQRIHYQRFEHPAPNDLWQMDFKGQFPLRQGYCHPLTVIDDHSRFSVALEACANQQQLTVQQRLIQIFRQYGLPQRMTMDNGSPWGSGGQTPLTELTAWLVRLGIAISHFPTLPPSNARKG